MDEQLDSVTTQLEAQEAQASQSANTPRFHTKRALVSYLDDQEKRNLLLGRQPLPGENLAQLVQRIEKYNEARHSRLSYTPTNPIVTKDDPILERIRTRQDIINTFAPTGLPW